MTVNHEILKELPMQMSQSLSLFLVTKHIVKKYFASVRSEGDFKQVILVTHYNNAC